jgi:hypothetical protein
MMMLRRSAWISLLLLAASPASSLPFEATAQKSASIPAAAFAPLVPSTTKRGDSGGALVVSGGVAGTFVAPIALADGSTIRSLSVVGVDNVDPGGIVARVLRVDRLEFGGTNPQVVAEAASTGTSAAVGTFATSAVTGGVVDAVRYYYYASVIVSPLTQVFGIRIGYDPPAAPGATKRLGIAGVTFEPRVSANSLKTSYLGILTTDSSSNESFVAPVQLPQGAVVSRFVFHARDFADINANARLVRVPVTAASGVAMAGLTSTGSDDAPREFSVSSIVNPTIDNVNNVYFAEIGVASSLEAYGVTIEYTGGASDTQDSPRGVSLLACVPASTVSDLRQPGATGTLRSPAVSAVYVLLAVLIVTRLLTKTGLMLGLGEEHSELLAVFADIAATWCSILTLGQYLRPSAAHLPVERYLPPPEFAVLREAALRFGFRHVESGPLVRSSYHAWEHVR